MAGWGSRAALWSAAFTGVGAVALAFSVRAMGSGDGCPREHQPPSVWLWTYTSAICGAVGIVLCAAVAVAMTRGTVDLTARTRWWIAVTAAAFALFYVAADIANLYSLHTGELIGPTRSECDGQA